MPSLSTARRVANAKNNGAKTIGQIYKEQSDWAMEETFENDIQSKVCYIYDFYHDDQPRLAESMTYENTTKTRIDAKFIIKSYQSMDKDQVDYYVQFRPSQSVRFSENDELYYFETDYKTTYGNTFPIGLYLDIPDDRNVYHKWLICREEKANQFPKYLVLPCDYELCWIETNGKDRIKRRMWSVLRMQSSYTIGQYTDRVFTRTDNQNKIWLPLNKLTEKFWYTNSEDTTMRIVVSAPTEHPLIWACTKIENIQPIGIQKLTIYQTVWSDNRDYIEKDENGNIIGMWASYFDSEIAPSDPDTPTPTPSPETNILASIICSASSIKVGGSYRTLNIKFTNDSGEDVTNDFDKATIEWSYTINGNNYSKIIENVISFNQRKIKMPDDYEQIGKILIISCTIFREDIGYIHSEQLQLEITE
ncbi:MAG TPA: hypothetical protein DCW90_24685 [Lachnospiraceae bacterium]|nr:hypothetical protein [Lachnospiraceae bacterium]